MRLFTKVSLEIANHPTYADFEAKFIECVNSHTDLGIDEFADFYVTYIGENIEVYDRCGDESGIFLIYEDLWASIIEDLRQRDKEIETLSIRRIRGKIRIWRSIGMDDEDCSPRCDRRGWRAWPRAQGSIRLWGCCSNK